MFTSVNEAETSSLFKHEQIKKYFHFKTLIIAAPPIKQFVRHLKSKYKKRHIMLIIESVYIIIKNKNLSTRKIKNKLLFFLVS